MNESTVDAMHQRLDRLERENRNWKRAVVVILLVMASIVLMGKALPSPQIVEAQKFLLKDHAGNIRAVLGQQSPEATLPSAAIAQYVTKPYGIHFYDADGRHVAGIGEIGRVHTSEEDDDGWELTLRAKNNASFARLAASPDWTSLELVGAKQTLEEAKREDRELWDKLREHPNMTVGEALARARATNPFNRLAGSIGANLWVSSIGSSLDVLSGSLTHPRGMQFSLYGDGRTSLRLTDEKGTSAVLGYTEVNEIKTGVTKIHPASSLVLFDENGTVISKVP